MSDRPNILLFFTDQMRFDCIGALGHPVIKTPNLDRLAATGTAFTDAYSPSPVCVPARCSLTYGQYPWHTGCYENNYPMPEDGRQSLMDALVAAGYTTHGIGKCHFTPDPWASRGFVTRERQEELVGNPAEDDYLRFLHGHGFSHICDPHGVRGELYYVPQPAQMPADLHPTQWVGDCACDWLQSPPSDQPWFLFCSFIHPHPPFCPPAPWHKLYRAADMPLPREPADFEALYTHVNRRQNRYKWRDQGFDLNLVRCLRAYYYACISFIDFQVGRVLDTLEAAGELDNTLILFTSDHGEHLGDYRCFGKRSYHDTCARVPLLARLPGRFPAGARCRRVTNLVDVMPTVLAAAGAACTTHAPDGLDLADVAAGRTDRHAVYGQHMRAGDAVYFSVSEQWKYVYAATDDREFFFDRQADPEETRSRLVSARNVDAFNACRDDLQAVLRAAGEDPALDGAAWHRYPPKALPEGPDTMLLYQDHPWADTTIPGYTTP